MSEHRSAPLHAGPFRAVWCLVLGLGAALPLHAAPPLPIPAALRIARAGAENPPSLEDRLQQADRPRDAFPEAVIRARITRATGAKEGFSAEVDLSRKGPDRSLIEFVSGKQRGRRVLIVGKDAWLIVPGSKRPVPVSASQRFIAGAAFEDLAPVRFSGYQATATGRVETVGDRPCDVLELTARDAHAAYPTATLWLDRKDSLARRARFNLRSGKPAREVFFDTYGKEGETLLLRTMRVVDLVSKKERAETRLEFVRYERATLPDALFTPEGARPK